MRRLAFLMVFLLAGCATTPPEIKRLSPVIKSSIIPAQCKVVSILKDSPAEKAGLKVGDVIKSVNGQTPHDAAALTELVGKAPQDSVFEVLKEGTSAQVNVHLNTARPRLGSVCDLAGWVKPGLTSAGNESVTVFEGPFAFTLSGIIDKGIIFLRVRLSNNSDKPLEVRPELFSATDTNGSALAVLSPRDVMCFLYGDKGAHLLSLKKQHKETLDTEGGVSGQEVGFGDRCESGPKGRLSGSDSQYAEANAQYLATESLWPATYQPGSVADGLIYLKETASLPVTLTAKAADQTLSAQLGSPVGSEKQMSHAQLVRFFEAQKKGNSLRLTLRHGKVFVGKFSTYDSVEERAWFNTPASGMLNTTSYSLEYIRNAEPLEQIPAAPAPTSGDLN